jgi:hypothetical protein
MSSNMTQIAEGFIQFPVPGVDNDSQGFRDRYSTIRTNLNIARTEIGELITNTAKINTNNNFGGNKIINVNLSSTTSEANTAEDGAPITANTLQISWQGGSVHVIRAGQGEDDGVGGQVPLSLSFTNWPTEGNRYAKITVIVNADVGGRAILWPTGIKKQQIIPSFDAESVTSLTGTKIFEVFTYDSGTTLFVNYLGLYE